MTRIVYIGEYDRELIDCDEWPDDSACLEDEPMTDTTAPVAFEPNWGKLAKEANGWMFNLERVIGEYEHQMIEEGFVVVRKDDVQAALAVLLGVANSDETNAESAEETMYRLHDAIKGKP